MNEENEARDRARDAAGLDAFLDTMVSLTGLDRESAFESCCSPNSEVHYPAKYAPAIWKAALGAGYDAGYERGKAENAELLECPMCSAPNAFVISQADPADGYCRVEGKVHTIRVLLCECAVRAPGQNVCLRCMRPYNKDGSAMGGRYS